MPAAAIQVSASQPDLILTISQMPDSAGARSILENVKRWARQLTLPTPTEADLDKLVTHLQLGGVPLDVVTMGGTTPSEAKLFGAILPHASDTWVFKLAGDPTVLDAQAGAFADFLRSIRFADSAAGPAVAGPPAPMPEPSAALAPPSAATGAGGAQWTLPPGWTAEGTSGLRIATIRPGNAPAEIKVSKLGIIGGGLGMNVTRWRGEVGLDPVDDEHADPGQPLKLGDQTWTLHDYTGPANGGTREIVALAEAGGNTWYFKLAGPTAVIETVKPRFDQFLATVRLGQ
jgi:hypothetical protein